MNQQMQRQPVQWPYFRLTPERDEPSDEMGSDTEEVRDTEPAQAERDAQTSSSTVSKVVINGRVVLQNNVLQSTMDAMVRRAVAQESPATLN